MAAKKMTYDLINDNTVKRVSPNSKSIYNSIPCNGLININDMLVLRLIWCAIFECYLTWVAICEIIKNIGKAVYIKFIRLFTQFVLMMPCLIFFPFFFGCVFRTMRWMLPASIRVTHWLRNSLCVITSSSKTILGAEFLDAH